MRSSTDKAGNTKNQVNLRSADGLMSGQEPGRRDLKTSIAGVAGNVLEWYDFSVYGYFSDVIGKTFFPPTDTEYGALVESFAVFGIAFLVRPIGGAVFGYLGDNRGRKFALENAIMLMAFPTLAMGCLPTYASVGWLSPALLICCRILQGFSVGGQVMSSMVFAMESSHESTWGMQGAAVNAATVFGNVLGSLFAYTLRATLTEEQTLSFGWRIPFLFGIVGIVPGYYLKHKIKEIPVPQPPGKVSPDATTTPSVGGKPQMERRGTFQATFAGDNRRALIASILVPCFTSGSYYVIFVWLAVFMKSIVNVPDAFGITSAVGFLGIGLAFAGGWLVDKLGRKARLPLMMSSSLALGIVAPFFINKVGEGDPTICFLLQSTMAILLGTFGGAMAPWLISLFPPHVRLTSVSFGYNVAASVVGGFSPLVATVLVQEYGNYAPGFLVSTLAVFAWIGLLIAPRGSAIGDAGDAGGGGAPNRLSSVV